MELWRIWTAVAPIGVLLIGGCSAAPSVHEESISDRGGFLEPEQRLATVGDEDYCGGEVLRWRYDEPAAMLRLADARLMLNCCGQRTVSVERIDSVVEITERDEPDRAEGRCEAQCAFDFALGLHDVTSEDVYLRLLRDVTDEQGSPSVVWSGLFALSEGAGVVVLDGVASDAGCQERMPLQRRTATVAAK
jgi:hypothetical protein